MRLHDLVETYIAFKRALGIRLCSEAGVLRAFCRAMGQIDVADVKPEAVLAFIAGTGPVTTNWKQKSSVLRSFYRYAIGRGFAAASPLPTTIPKFPPSKTPYIYSSAELKRLLVATDMLQTPRAPLRALVFPSACRPQTKRLRDSSVPCGQILHPRFRPARRVVRLDAIFSEG